MQLDKRPAVNHILQYPARVLHHFNKSRLSLSSFRSRLASLGMSAAASWFCNSAMFALTFSAIARGPSSSVIAFSSIGYLPAKFAEQSDHALTEGDGFLRLMAMAIGSIARSEEHTSELQSLMRISYAVFCLKK